MTFVNNGIRSALRSNYETQHMQFSPMHCCASVALDRHSTQATVAVVLHNLKAYHSVQQDTHRMTIKNVSFNSAVPHLWFALS